ncbi:MAG: hypothetical protein HFE54_06155 [Turicibacter sp.]|uniref:Uncharacterized protein n=1 Tax=Turicibacter faecis TaxID=2963365 RepID=A0ABM8IHN1_9FIRM|nr:MULTISPECIES: hypothetical protein [unclassified Turicibacter]MCI9351512.1 hypothetical protein [Turicibacter sp.]MCU7204574.1 hypothetical protein [Turicibacter sp. TA25]MCU7210039.1 hypothetical protein [Turicibacter sp. 1E2]BEH90728.1 hypothetical protein T23_08300 [Turicibacter sp. TC023]
MADVDDASIEDYDIADEDSGSSIDRYKGSTFASLLVIILFVIWFLYRMGCIGQR